MNSYYWAQEPTYKPSYAPYTGHCPEHGDWTNYIVDICPVEDGLGSGYKKKPKQEKLVEQLFLPIGARYLC